MNRTGKIIVGTTIPVVLALMVGGAEIANYHYNDSLDPSAPFLRSQLTHLMNKEGINSVNKVCSAIKDFYINNGEGTLLAIQQGNDFAFVYYKKGDQSDEYKRHCLAAKYKNWSAVRKYVEITEVLEKANEKIRKATDKVSKAQDKYDKACAHLKLQKTTHDIGVAKGSRDYCKRLLGNAQEVLADAQTELAKFSKVISEFDLID